MSSVVNGRKIRRIALTVLLTLPLAFLFQQKIEKYRKEYSAIVGIIGKNGALAPLCILRYAKGVGESPANR